MKFDVNPMHRKSVSSTVHTSTVASGAIVQIGCR